MRWLHLGTRALALFAVALLASCGSNDTYSPTFGGAGGGGGTGVPSLSVQVGPATVTVNQGQTATYTVTVKGTGGCAGPVALTASGLPTGATATLNPTSVNATEQGVTSTLSITTPAGQGNLTGDIRSPRVARSRQEGNTSTITVTGTGCDLTKSGTAQLVVQAANAPSFTITGGGSKTVQAGQAATYSFTLTSVNGFAGNVAFTMTGLPAGATATFAPTNVNLTANGTATGSLTIQTATSTPAATSTPNIVATSGTVTNQAAITLIVTGGGGGVSLFNAPNKVVVTPNRQFAYVINGGGLSFNAPGFVSQHTVNANGTLSNLTTATLPTQNHPSDVAIDSTGNFLYVTDFGDNNNLGRVYQFRIGSNGLLTALSPATLTTNIRHPNGILIDPSNKYLYVANGDGPIAMFIRNVDGTLTQNGAVNGVSIPAFMTTDPAGKFLYVSGQSGTAQYKINADGTLTQIGTSLATRMLDMGVDSTGSTLYGTEYNGSKVFTFTINADGSLTPLSPGSIPAGAFSQGLAITPNNQFVYVSDDTTFTAPGQVLLFKRNQTGTLSPLSPASIPTQNSPNHLTVDPPGSTLYVPNVRSDTVQVFGINADGSLTPR